MNVKTVQKCSSINDPWDTIFTEKVSLKIAEFFAKVGISANTTTVFSMVCGIFGGICFAFTNIWITLLGIFFEIMGALFDCADGQVARLTKSGSRFGRFFDGFADGIVYFSIYMGVAIRLINEPIFGSQSNWSFYSFLLVIPVGAYFHSRQARLEDYLKQIHMFMIKNDKGSELDTSKSLTELYSKQKLSFFNWIIVHSYITYTKQQEMENPSTQLLLDQISSSGVGIPKAISDLYAENEKYVKLTNLLGFNLRTYVLFIFLIVDSFTNVGLPAWHFIFIAFILESIALFIEFKYEKIAKQALKVGFNK